MVSAEFLTPHFIMVTSCHCGAKMASGKDSMGHGRSAAKAGSFGTHRKIPNVPWAAWPSGLIKIEAQCPRGEKSSQDSCGISQGTLQLLLSRQYLLTVYKWKTWKHKSLSQFWAGRRLAAAACAAGMPGVCAEWSGCVCTGVDAAVRFSILSHSKQTAHCSQGTGLSELPCRRDFQQQP